MDFLREFPYALWPEKSNKPNQSSVRPCIKALRSIKVGPRMDLPKLRANSFGGFSIDGGLWQNKPFFCGFVTIPIRCSMTTQPKLSTTSYTGATSVLRSVALLITHPVYIYQPRLADHGGRGAPICEPRRPKGNSCHRRLYVVLKRRRAPIENIIY
jgi:hypothetical protein